MTATPAPQPRCVVCGAALNACEGALTCSGCGHVYQTRLGIADVRHPSRRAPTAHEWIGEKLLPCFEASSFEQLAGLYFEHANPHLAQFQRQFEHFRDHKLRQVQRGQRFVRMFMAAAAETFGPGARRTALEIGCGSGAGLLELARHFDHVVGLDPDLPNLILARKSLDEHGQRNVSLFQGYAQNIPYGPGTFDAIFAQNTLEHVFEVETVLAEIQRVLVGQGVFVADSRNRYDLFFPEPHTGLRWVGLLPREWAKAYVLRRTGLPYDHTFLLSYFDLQRALRQCFGSGRYRIRLPLVGAYGYPERIGAALRRLEPLPVISHTMLLVFPSHLVVAQKSSA